MALSKDISQPSGLTLSYWRVIQTNVSDLNKTGRVALVGYKDEQTRLDSPTDGHADRISETVAEEDYNTYFAPSVLDAENTNRVQQAYELVKDRAANAEEHPMEGATDV